MSQDLHSIVVLRGLYRTKGRVGLVRVRAEALRKASFSLWKEECMDVVGSRGSDKEILETL